MFDVENVQKLFPKHIYLLKLLKVDMKETQLVQITVLWLLMRILFQYC